MICDGDLHVFNLLFTPLKCIRQVRGHVHYVLDGVFVEHGEICGVGSIAEEQSRQNLNRKNDGSRDVKVAHCF